MTKTYRFESYDEDDKTVVKYEFDTDSPLWSGFDGPMFHFFNFLKGCGFCFGLEDQIGIADENEFKSATAEF